MNYKCAAQWIFTKGTDSNKQTPYQRKRILPRSPPSARAVTLPLRVATVRASTLINQLCPFWTFYTWNHILCTLLHLASFTPHDCANQHTAAWVVCRLFSFLYDSWKYTHLTPYLPILCRSTGGVSSLELWQQYSSMWHLIYIEAHILLSTFLRMYLLVPQENVEQEQRIFV